MVNCYTAYSDDSDKMNACFMTINSSEEKHLFKKSLSTGDNAGKFAFHELVPEDAESQNWYDLACEKNIRCDLLVISGHFGGSFFGASGASLSMEEMETKSCQKTCKGIMSDPKEVFLLGCNTLAGKDEDNRSASEYLAVLLEDDIPLEEASRIVEQRYGAIGTSFKQNMKRAFQGVPHIYGFHSVGPSGKSIERLLNNYHEKVPNYYDHLLKIEVERGLALMDDFSKWNNNNEELAEALRITYFAQTSGVLIPCRTDFGLESDDPMVNVLNNICGLRSGGMDENQAVEHIIDLLLGDDFALYLPTISSYLENNDLKEKMTSIIAENPIIKEKIIHLLNESKTGFGKLEVARIAESMNIISHEELVDYEKKAILSYLAIPVSLESKDAVCSYYSENKIVFQKDDFDDSLFTDSYGLGAIGCLAIDDRKVVHRILDVAKNNSKQKIRVSALIALQTSRIRDDKILEFLNETLIKSKSKEEEVIAYFIGARLGQNDDIYLKKFDEYLQSRGTIKVYGDVTPIRKVSEMSLYFLTFKDYAQLKSKFTLVEEKGFSLDNPEYVIGGAATKLTESEQLLFLKDPKFKNNKKVRSAYYNMLGKDKDEFEPSSLMDDSFAVKYFLDDRERFGEDEFQFYELGEFNFPSDESQKSLIDELNSRSFSKEDWASIIYFLPEERKGNAIIDFMVDLYQSDSVTYTSSLSTHFYNNVDSLTDYEKEKLKPLLKTDDYWLKRKLTELGVTEPEVTEPEVTELNATE
jgi:hypothetical protein